MPQTQIGLGLAALGRPDYINIRADKNIDKSEATFRKNALDMLDFAYAHGVRYFDTAPSYGKGEEFLLDWYKKQNVEDVELGTKWGYTYVANWQIGYTGPHEIKEHSLAKLKEQWAVSKELLPALKVYQIHSATFESGVLEKQEVLEHLLELKQTNDLKIGLTTSGANQKEVIEKALSIHLGGVELFDSIQSTYNILEQDTFPILGQAKEAGKTVIIKEALANGRLFENKKYRHYKEIYNTLALLAEKYAVGVDAIALRYVMDSLNPNLVLSGAAQKEQLTQNLKAREFRLLADDIASLEAHKVEAKHYWEERSALGWD